MTPRSRTYSPRRGSGIPRHARNAAVDRIYRDAAGNLPDFTRLDRRSPRWRRWIIGGGLVTLAVLAVAAWVSFLIFKPYSAPGGGDVTVRIDAPTTADIGEELAYRVTLENDERVPLATAALELRFPDDFAVTTATPAPDDARGFRWSFGALPAGEKRNIEVRGRPYAAPDTAVRLEAVAVYRPANFNAEFQTIAQATTTLGASPIAVTITGPDRTVPGAPVTYAIAYENVSAATTPNAVIALEVPRTFTLATAKPDRARSDALLWSIGALAPHAKGAVAVTGSFTSGAKEPYAVRATVAAEPAPDRRITLHAATIATAVLGGDAVLIATVNDQTTGFPTTPGDALRFRITVRNDGAEAFHALRMHAIFEATSVGERSILNFSSIADPTNGAAVGEQLAPGLRRGTITWTEKEIANLALVPPGEQRQVDFTIPLHTASSLSGFPAQGRVTFTAAVEIPKTGATEQPRRVTTSPIAIEVK